MSNSKMIYVFHKDAMTTVWNDLFRSRNVAHV